MAPTDEPKTYTQDQVEELLNATAEKAAEAAVQKVLSATAGKAERDELGETLASYSDIRKLPKPPGPWWHPFYESRSAGPATSH